jgi:uncharacterized membrane protein (UPF0127 family)
MLFVFPTPGLYGFWMKEMEFPIDIFWLDAQGHVIFIKKNTDPSSYPHVFYSERSASYVLETVAGFADAHSVALGAKLELKNIPTVSK